MEVEDNLEYKGSGEVWGEQDNPDH